MLRQITCVGFITGSFLLTGCASATQLSAVGYGTITEVSQQQKDTSNARSSGAVIGGLIGLASSRGRSTGTKIVRSGVSAGLGSAIGGSAAAGTETAYTVTLVDGGTVRVVMDSGNFRTGDCVAIERGRTNNMRMVSQEFCMNNQQVPEQYKAEHVKEALECAQAKEELLAAQTPEALEMAHMKMNILCEE